MPACVSTLSLMIGDVGRIKQNQCFPSLHAVRKPSTHYTVSAYSAEKMQIHIEHLFIFSTACKSLQWCMNQLQHQFTTLFPFLKKQRELSPLQLLQLSLTVKHLSACCFSVIACDFSVWLYSRLSASVF